MSQAEAFSVAGNTVSFSTEALPEWFVNVIFEQELESLEAVLAALQSDDVFYDIGANYGLYSLFAAEEMDDGEVVAVEPYPPNGRSLEENARLNDVSNLTVFECALGDTDEVRQFEPPTSENYATATFRSSEVTDETIPMETRRGDSLVVEEELPNPNVVKIDVEGAEPKVITGMSEMLGHDQCRYLLCELHPPDSDAAQLQSLADYDSSVDEILEKIKALGFDTMLYSRDGQFHVVATK